MTRRALAGVTAALLALCGGTVGSDPAIASQTASPPSSTTFNARFSPNRLGAYSTMEVGFHLYRPGGAMPPPLVDVDFLLPPGVSLTTSGLGLEACAPETVQRMGSEGCPPDAVMGYGGALMIAPTAVEGIVEPADVTVVEAPAENRHTTLLFDVDGKAPVIAEVLAVGQMLEASRPFEGNLSTSFPVTPGLPGESDVSVISLRAGIGSKGVTYYREANGVRTPYTPKGMIEPARCPVGGFRFGARFRFADGSRETVSTTSPCPRHSHHARKRRHG